MTNILDYVIWRGDLPLTQYPFNEADALAMACLCYLDFRGISDGTGWTLAEAKRLDLLTPVATSGSWYRRKALFEAMADSKRFADCRMRHYISVTDEDLNMQFSAMCIDLTDDTTCVAFRGTDNTIVGWREDFDMAYRDAVPGQQAARYYLEKVAALHDRPLRIVGHSKGGNLGAYAAATAQLESHDEHQIREVYSFDGPGMKEDVFNSEGYRKILPLLKSFIPQTSIIGLLMNYHRNYTVIHSEATGIAQHDAFSWGVVGTGFVKEEKIDRRAELISETLHEWLDHSTPEQRGAFVEALFKLVEETRATRMSDLLDSRVKSLATMAGATRDLDPETRKVFMHLISEFVTLGAGNVWDRVKDTQIVTGAGNVWEKVTDARIVSEAGHLFGKFKGLIDNLGNKDNG